MPLVTRFWRHMGHDDEKIILLTVSAYYPKPVYGIEADMVLMTNDGTRGDEVLKRSGNKRERFFCATA